MGPRVLSMLCLHFYFLARDRFASFYQEGGISALNNGWFIMQLPETLIGTAIAIALLPSLAEFVTRRRRAGLSPDDQPRPARHAGPDAASGGVLACVFVL